MTQESALQALIELREFLGEPATGRIVRREVGEWTPVLQSMQPPTTPDADQ